MASKLRRLRKSSVCHARRLIALSKKPKEANARIAAMAGSNSPSIRELALAALARQRGGGETARETAVRQGVSPLHPASHPREIPISGVDQPLSFGVSPSHAME